jgi:two-component system phosphate regulon response regulator PhoB
MSERMNPRILIVEDEDALTLLLRYNLEAAGYDVEAVARGDEADVRLKEGAPDLVILDWMLPGLSGIELCRRLRSRPESRQLPIIMLTARGEESERVRGLSTGADDYIVKPFSVPELLARVAALLRRSAPERIADVLGFGDIAIDREKKRVTRAGRAIDLGPTEYRLLEFLMQRPGRVFSREQLLDGVWGSDIYIDERTVDVHVGRLRKALNRGHETRQAGVGEARLLRPERRRPPIAAQVGRLIGDTRMIRAIGQAGRRLTAAEEEVRAAGIADRPPAGRLRELEQRAPLTDRNDVVEDLRLGLHIVVVGVRQRGIAAYRVARDPQHVRMHPRLARAWRTGGGRFGAARQAEPVHLADHCVAGDAAQFGRDLARRKAVGPQLLQQFDAFVSPAHASKSSADAAATCPAESALGSGQRSVGPTRLPTHD